MAEMKSLGRSEDIKSTQKAMEQAESFFIGIPDKKTPWYLLDLEYADGFVHWYETAGQRRRVVCAGGLEGKGFATDDCPICAYVLELYQESKRYKEEGNDAKATQLKEKANGLHAKAEVQFKAIRGERTLLKTKTGKEWIADWDMDDEESSAAIGIISLSESQFEGLTGMIKGEDTAFIQEGDDLGKRILWTAKEKRKNKKGTKYSAVVWDADEEETEIPEVEIEQELLDIDLSENYVIDIGETEKVFSLVSGQSLEEPDEDEEVELEDDSQDEPEDADLNDLDEDEDPDGDVELPFEDDDPDDSGPKSEPERPKKGSTKKTTTTSTRVKSGKAKAQSSKTKTSSRKSGKTRM